MDMTITQLTGLAALLIYLGIALWQIKGLTRGTETNRMILQSAAMAALVLHGYSVLNLIHTAMGINLGLFQVSSLIFWVISIVLVISSLRIPVHNLGVFIFPLAALSIACSLNLQSHYTPEQHISKEIGWHILLSIISYSVLTIAAIQAVALLLQDKLLREKKFHGPLAVLPPLQVMEAFLFEMLWAGSVLLTLSLGTGFLFFENMREQHLTHKMAFSSIAWLIYTLLLWGRVTRGWRGRKAIHWTLGGFVSLMLAYFGSKLVLELILA